MCRSGQGRDEGRVHKAGVGAFWFGTNTDKSGSDAWIDPTLIRGTQEEREACHGDRFDLRRGGRRIRKWAHSGKRECPVFKRSGSVVGKIGWLVVVDRRPQLIR